MRQSSVISSLWAMMFLFPHLDIDFNYLCFYLDRLGCHSVSAISLLDLADHKHDDTKIIRNFQKTINFSNTAVRASNVSASVSFGGGGQGGRRRQWSWLNRGTKRCPVMFGLRTEVRNGDFRKVTRGRRVQSRVRSRYCISHCVTRFLMESTRILL
jgi:hypothetical protein